MGCNCGNKKRTTWTYRQARNRVRAQNQQNPDTQPNSLTAGGATESPDNGGNGSESS